MRKLHQKLFWLFIFLLPLQIGRHFWPSFSSVLGLRIDYLSPTIYFTDILLVIILGLWIWGIRDKRYVIRKILKNYWWILAIFVFLFLNAFLAQNQGAAFYYFIKIIELTLLGIYVAQNHYPLSIIHYPLSLAVVYSSLIALAQFFKQASLNGITWWLGERTFNLATPGIAKTILNGRLLMRPYGTFPHPNVLAGFILVALILIFFSSQNLSTLKKIVRYSALFLGMLAIIFSFSRSVWLIGLIVLGLRGFFVKNKKVKITVLLIIFLLLMIVLSYGAGFSTNEAFFQRFQLMKATQLMVKLAPLSGIGLNNFIVRLPEFWPITGFTYWLQPVHNIYLLIMAETGLMGLLIFAWLVILTYKRLLDSLSISRYPLVMSLTVILLLGLADHYWLTLQQTQFFLAVILGLAWSSKM